MQSTGDSLASSPTVTAPSSPTHHPASGGGNYYFFSAPASPVHYILRSPPSSTAAMSTSFFPPDGSDGDDFEFTGRHHAVSSMSSAEELFLAGKIRVGRPSALLSPIHQEEDHEEEGDGDGLRYRRAKSASPPRSPRFPWPEGGAEQKDELPKEKTVLPDSASSSMSSTSSSSSAAAKSLRRRISLRDFLGRSRSEVAASERSGFWPSIWSSISKKERARGKAELPSRPPATAPVAAPASVPVPVQAGRRSASSNRPMPAARATGSVAREEVRRRTTSLPYRHGLLLGCLGLSARSYGLAKSIHPLSSR